jgi:uncharacterized protein YukE
VTAHVARTGEIADVTDELASITDQLDDALDDATQAAKRLHSVWTGEGASAHRRAHDRWSIAEESMHRSLVELRWAMHGATGNYEAAARANERMWT